MDRIEQAIKASLIRPELNALYPEDEQGRRRWLGIVAPSAILPGDWPVETDADRAADACWILQHGERA